MGLQTILQPGVKACRYFDNPAPISRARSPDSLSGKSAKPTASGPGRASRAVLVPQGIDALLKQSHLLW